MKAKVVRVASVCVFAVTIFSTACTDYPLLGIFGLGQVAGDADANTPTSQPASQPASQPVANSSALFKSNTLSERTFTNGTTVTTVTVSPGDVSRLQVAIDFNNDGKPDAVVGYGEEQAVIQILLSQGDATTVDYLSLTLDSKRDMIDLADIAVGDIDRDGHPDIVAAAKQVWYFHHPSNGDTTDLRQWGNLNDDPNAPIFEKISASETTLTDEEVQQLIEQALGPGVNTGNYIITIDQRYTRVAIGDFNTDGWDDVAAARTFHITLTPLPDVPVPAVDIFDGDVLLFLNPGAAIDGNNWTIVSIGAHERQPRLDRDGATGLAISDIDSDGDLDIISSAQNDNNVQVAWFENPGQPLDTSHTWTQWRIGSVRDALSLALADFTGDGLPDVVCVGGLQQQMILFEQPASGPKRPYDWDTFALATFEDINPLDVKAIDIDNDGLPEAVVGGSAGAVRSFKPGADPRLPWSMTVVQDFDPPGDVGLIGYGDVDGDGDLDLIIVVSDSSDDNNDRVVWLQNNLAIAGL